MEWLAGSLRENLLLGGFAAAGLAGERRPSREPKAFSWCLAWRSELRAYVDHHRLRTTLDSHDRGDRES
jgi:hypothetical protein